MQRQLAQERPTTKAVGTKAAGHKGSWPPALQPPRLNSVKLMARLGENGSRGRRIGGAAGPGKIGIGKDPAIEQDQAGQMSLSGSVGMEELAPEVGVAHGLAMEFTVCECPKCKVDGQVGWRKTS